MLAADFARGYAPLPRPSIVFHLSMQFSRTRLATHRLIGVALLAMLLGQWSVLVHSIDHARAHEVVEQSVDGDHAHDHDHAWGHHAGTPTCQLVDHLLVGQAAGGEPAPILWLPPAATRLAALTPSVSPAPASLAYEARGPPRA
jgi:hypothetical protein